MHVSMAALAKYLILGAAVSSIWGGEARAEGPSAPLPTPPTAPAPPVESNPEPSAPAGMTDEELAKLSQGEAIEIFDERPNKPFDRDTEIRLTGEQLAPRGAVDLGTALALLPDVTGRDAGRGGYNIDIRGARKGDVSIFIDGVLVTDPWYGTFDVSSIPITDIVQIRVATTPQSPIDGPGGPGGVIEVHTRDAYGSQLVIARLTADTLPTVGVTGTARVALAKDLALRLSGSGVMGAENFTLPATSATFPGDSHSATGAARLDYRHDDNRLVIDGFVDDRHYVSPPSDTTSTDPILLVDREATQRLSAKGDVKEDDWQIEGEGWYHHLYRRSLDFMEAPTPSSETGFEELDASRAGAFVLVTHPI